MRVIISFLRGVNLAGRHMIRMDDLRALYAALGLRDVQSHLQSGNVVFRTKDRNLLTLAKRIEAAIEKKYGFHCDVILRTTADLRAVIARSPFARRRGLEPSKLLVTFLADHPPKELSTQILAIQPEPEEELRLDGRELYVYFPDGMGHSKLFRTLFGKLLKKEGTGRNWNTVTKLLEIAEALEAL
jgi:uncharacterized protein (DUF1697 family)